MGGPRSTDTPPPKTAAVKADGVKLARTYRQTNQLDSERQVQCWCGIKKTGNRPESAFLRSYHSLEGVFLAAQPTQTQRGAHAGTHTETMGHKRFHVSFTWIVSGFVYCSHANSRDSLTLSLACKHCCVGLRDSQAFRGVLGVSGRYELPDVLRA